MAAERLLMQRSIMVLNAGLQIRSSSELDDARTARAEVPKRTVRWGALIEEDSRTLLCTQEIR